MGGDLKLSNTQSIDLYRGEDKYIDKFPEGGEVRKARSGKRSKMAEGEVIGRGHPRNTAPSPIVRQDLVEISRRVREGSSSERANCLDVLIFDGPATIGAIAAKLHLDAIDVELELDNLSRERIVSEIASEGRLVRYSIDS